jgi:hypothetical protein
MYLPLMATDSPGRAQLYQPMIIPALVLPLIDHLPVGHQIEQLSLVPQERVLLFVLVRQHT